MKEKDSNNTTGKKKSWRIYLPLIVVVLAIVAGGLYWYRQYKMYIKTDDAYVDTDNISVSAKMMGQVEAVFFKEGDRVGEGELMAELDSSDLIAQREKARTAVKQAEASVTQVKAQYTYDQKSIKLLEVNLKKAQTDFARAEDQFAGGVIPKEQYEHTQNALESAEAKLEAAQSELKASKARIGSAEAAVKAAEAQIDVINTQLDNTRLYAPIDGIVAKRWLLTGDMAQPGQAVYTVTNNKKLWVIAYLEETKIAGVHLGQQARFTLDAFPGTTFLGTVFLIGSNTASQFSLIPPNNASGNFTKVTQRIPVKISIDKTTGNGPVSDYNIVAGMSAVIKIVRDE